MPILCLLPLMSSRYDFLKKLSLILNSHIFYILSDIIAYIRDYLKRKIRIALYIYVIKHALTILT